MVYPSRHSPTLLHFFVLFIAFASVCQAFGAGNIASVSRVEGQNWRHGDIEDTLLGLQMAKIAGGKKFRGLDVKRVYFGNWLRDYSQAIDVGTVKKIPADAIRILLWILAFLTFGYGTAEFEVTAERLGCYRPEEHIDNPRDYADNVDARQFDSRLRGPVDVAAELAIDHRTGLKAYIASEDKGFTTSAGLVRRLFGRCIELGRQYGRTKDKKDLYEALRLLGTGSHCLEDFSAHSNYVELSLRNCGGVNVFPMVGRDVNLRVQGVDHVIFPIVTGTFGGVDFLHSVTGEFSDHVTQSEIQELEGSVQSAQNQQNSSLLKELLSKLPSAIFGGKDEAARVDELQADAAAHQMRGLSIGPQSGSDWQEQLKDVSRQIYPILEFHDEVMQKITSFIEHVPILPGLIDKISEQINIFVFSLLAPYVLPIITQVKTELTFGSSEIIEHSRAQQLNIFKDNHCSDPTHSMLSKDHFSHVLNEPAGKVASQILKWVIPQIMSCWDDERIDVNRTLDRIVRGVFHHPALRNQGDDGARECRQLMFGVVEKWWRDKSEQERKLLHNQLSREGVEAGRNHKEGVHDTGHGSCKPPGKIQGQGIAGMASNMTGGSLPGFTSASTSTPGVNRIQNLASEAVGGGVLGNLVGGLVGKVGGNLLGKTFAGRQDEIYSSQQQSQNPDHSVTTTYTQAGHHPSNYGEPEKYGQAQLQQTTYPSGGTGQYYQRYEQDGHGGQTGYGFQQKVDTTPSYGGGYDQKIEQSYSVPGGQWQEETQHQHIGPNPQPPAHEAQSYNQGPHHGSPSGSDSADSSDDGDIAGMDKQERKRLKKERKRRERQERQERKRREHEMMTAPNQDSPGHPPPGPPSSSEGGYGSYPSQDYPPAPTASHPYPAPGPPSGSGFYNNPPNMQPPFGMAGGPQQSGEYPQYGSNYSSPPYMSSGPGSYLANAAASTAWDNQQQYPPNQGPPPPQQQYPPYPPPAGGYGSVGPNQGYGGPGPGQYAYGGGGGQGYPSQNSGFPGAQGHGAQSHGSDFPGAQGHGAQSHEYGQQPQGGSYSQGSGNDGYSWFNR